MDREHRGNHIAGLAGIFQGAGELINYINEKYHFAPGEKLNIVAHSHAGNVVLLAADFFNHKVDNLVTLGMPVNYDILPYESNGNIENYCAVSSLTDWVQWAAAGVDQIYQTGFWTDAFTQDEHLAIQALIHGDWEDFFFYQQQAADDAHEAILWFLSTKIVVGADHNVLLSGYDHGDLHTRAVWNRITQPCGLSH